MLTAFQALLNYDCYLDSVLYQIYIEPLSVPIIMKLSIRACEIERRLRKCKDVCINNRDELYQELRKLSSKKAPP